MNLGAEAAAGGDRARLIRELDRMAALGLKNLRVLAASEGPDQEPGWMRWRSATPWRIVPTMQPRPGQYNMAVVRGLDFLLAQLRVRNMTAVLMLGNMWPWSGGFAQYVSWSSGSLIPYMPPARGGNWDKYQRFASRFYTDEVALSAYSAHVQFVASRLNEVTGEYYRSDPTIMAYQLANEPRAMRSVTAYRKWIGATAALLKRLSPSHLVTTGSEGRTPFAYSYVGLDPMADHALSEIDYMTVHVWPQNWDWFHPESEQTLEPAINRSLHYIRDHVALASRLGKPLVVEEFGMARDSNSHKAGTTLRCRDRFYALVLAELVEHATQGSPLVGANFWAWGGEGRPRAARPPGAALAAEHCWQLSDPLLGDPPHEAAGWYSVFDTDASTARVLRNFSSELEALDRAS